MENLKLIIVLLHFPIAHLYAAGHVCETVTAHGTKHRIKLEGCIDDERQFKTAKRSKGYYWWHFSSTSAW